MRGRTVAPNVSLSFNLPGTCEIKCENIRMTFTHRKEFLRRPSPPGYRPTYEIRQIRFAPSSVTRNAPSFATVTPTGRPHTFPSGVTKPVMKSSYKPAGVPLWMGTRISF